MTSVPKYDVFLSYRTQEREHASRIREALIQSNFTVLWDQDFVAGVDLNTVIAKGLNASRSVVVLWSIESRKAPWVLKEASSARKRGVLIPVKIERIELPCEFRGVLTHDLVYWTGQRHDTKFQGLCKAIRSKLEEVESGKVEEQPAPWCLPRPPSLSLQQRIMLFGLLRVVLLVVPWLFVEDFARWIAHLRVLELPKNSNVSARISSCESHSTSGSEGELDVAMWPECVTSSVARADIEDKISKRMVSAPLSVEALRRGDTATICWTPASTNREVSGSIAIWDEGEVPAAGYELRLTPECARCAAKAVTGPDGRFRLGVPVACNGSALDVIIKDGRGRAWEFLLGAGDNSHLVLDAPRVSRVEPDKKGYFEYRVELSRRAGKEGRYMLTGGLWIADGGGKSGRLLTRGSPPAKGAEVRPRLLDSKEVENLCQVFNRAGRSYLGVAAKYVEECNPKCYFLPSPKGRGAFVRRCPGAAPSDCDFWSGTMDIPVPSTRVRPEDPLCGDRYCECN